MDRRTKHTLVMTAGIIFVLLMSMAMFYLGGIIRPVWVIIICEFVFSFIAIPRFVYLYYKLYKSKVSFFVTLFIPVYNATLAMSKLITNLVLANIVLLIVVGLGTYNVQLFFTGNEITFMNLLSILNYTLFGLMLSLFLLTGFGLARVFLKIGELYNLAFDVSDVKFGFYKFIDVFLSASGFLAAIFFAIPVVRIIPMILLLEKCSELDAAGVSFYDYYDYEEYDEEDYEE